MQVSECGPQAILDICASPNLEALNFKFFYIPSFWASGGPNTFQHLLWPFMDFSSRELTRMRDHVSFIFGSDTLHR